MTGKHRDFVFKPARSYPVGTHLKLEKIIKEGQSESIIRVRAKMGYVNDVYILHASEPKKYIGKNLVIKKVVPDFMRNTYYLQPSIV
ncbi:MAG: hypothetical protein ABIH63_02680 [archaeon]